MTKPTEYTSNPPPESVPVWALTQAEKDLLACLRTHLGQGEYPVTGWPGVIDWCRRMKIRTIRGTTPGELTLKRWGVPVANLYHRNGIWTTNYILSCWFVERRFGTGKFRGKKRSEWNARHKGGQLIRYNRADVGQAAERDYVRRGLSTPGIAGGGNPPGPETGR